MSNESKGIQDVTLYICLFHPQRKVIIVLCHIAEPQKNNAGIYNSGIDCIKCYSLTKFF